jgi:protein tyrosine kinase modulator
MLPGKTYTPEDVLRILRRRFWLLLVPFAVVSAGTAIFARMLPDRYRSEALLLVVPQRVPEAFVRSTVTTRIEDRLQAISAQILSRTKLEQIIREFDLYARERQTGIMEDIVERMRLRDTQLQVSKGDAFTVTYYGPDARTVMKVTERLAGLFIDESLKDRQQLAEGTDQFLESTLEDARRRLKDQEKKLEEYRMRFSGQLPSQVEGNLQAVQTAMSAIKSTDEAISNDRQRRLMLEKTLRELESDAPPPDSTPAVSSPTAGSPDSPTSGSTTAQTLAAAKQLLAVMRQHYSDTWPDVKRQARYVDELQRKLDAEALERPVSVSEPQSPVAAAETTRQRRIASLQDDIAALDRQIAARETEEKRLRAIASGYQTKIEAAPARESEMTELMRDYSTLTNQYTSLLQKREESKIAANLERRQIGEQFKLLDPASMPQKPFSPNRQTINMVGMVAGFALGLGLIALLEYRDVTFKTDEEITNLLALPVLAIVPVMESDADRRRAWRRRWFLNISLGSAVLGCLAVVAYTFVR